MMHIFFLTVVLLRNENVCGARGKFPSSFDNILCSSLFFYEMRNDGKREERWTGQKVLDVMKGITI